MIGTAAAEFMPGLGRVAGVSGLAARTLGLRGSAPWPIAAAFVLGLPFGAALVFAVSGPLPAVFHGLTVVLIAARVRVRPRP